MKPRRARGMVLVIIVVGIASLGGCIGQAIIYFGRGEQPSLDVGMPTLLGTALIAGIAYGIADWPRTDESDAPVDRAVSKSRLIPGNIAIFTLVQLVAGEALAILALANGSWPDAVALAAPLLYGGVFSFVLALVGTLIAGMVMWPVAELIITGERALRGRPIDRRAIAAALALLGVVAFGILLVISTHVTAADGTPRQRGLLMIARLFIDYSGGTVNQIEAWFARALAVALVANLVWSLSPARTRASSPPDR